MNHLYDILKMKKELEYLKKKKLQLDDQILKLESEIKANEP